VETHTHARTELNDRYTYTYGSIVDTAAAAAVVMRIVRGCWLLLLLLLLVKASISLQVGRSVPDIDTRPYAMASTCGSIMALASHLRTPILLLRQHKTSRHDNTREMSPFYYDS